jgi:hypothetical protein
MKFKSPEFKKLKREWYKKLADDGFEDIEKNEMELFEPTRMLTEVHEATYRYFVNAKNFLESGSFETKKDKVLWFMHSEGWLGTEIAKMLSMTESKVSRTIAKYEARVKG